MAESSCFPWVRTSGPSIARLNQMSWVEAHWVWRPFLSERTSGSNWRPLEEFMFNIFQLCCCYWIIHISLISLEGTACVSIAFYHLSAISCCMGCLHLLLLSKCVSALKAQGLQSLTFGIQLVSAKIQDMAAVVHGDQDVIANHWYVIPRWPSAILFHQWLVRRIRLSPTTSLRELWEHLFSQKALPSSVLTLTPTAIRWSVTWTIDRGPKKLSEIQSGHLILAPIWVCLKIVYP